MADIRKLTVLGRSDFSSIPMITQFVAESAEAALLDDDAIAHCQLAVDEACTNVIEHAYEHDPELTFEVICTIEPGTLTIKVLDEGKEFDPTAAPPPQFSDNLDDIRPGGVGIHLIKKLMDDVRYEYVDDRNSLTMVKTSANQPPVDSTSDISQRTERDVVVVTPKGQVDSMVATSLDELLSNIIKGGAKRILIDMHELTYISSKGLKALVSGWRAARDSGGELALCAITPRVRNIVDMIGLNQVFSVYQSVGEAIDAMQEGAAS
jgi:anti-anti-sigma factor